MINNRQAGRRNRGRNNNGRPNGNNRGGGDNGNRIDNRARGNATQLLEKYKNMARDAQMAGDRVNAEYYLQFADHYFRVLADNRARQEEQQQRFRPRDDNFDEDGEDFDSSEENGEDMRAESTQPERSGREYQARDNQDRRPDDQRDSRGPRRDRNRRDRFSNEEDVAPQQTMGAEGPVGNPADDQSARPSPATASAQAAPVDETTPPKPRRGRPRKADKVDKADKADAAEGFDAALLPPSIARSDNDGDGAEDAPRKRTRRPRAAAAEAAE
ncbi:hypothetical protein J3E64_001851 [Sphingobium sp. OAS761]|uniref:DUF4167 domain-containing protein n=1 Tax=Sphingobium sp. OAS761 TaxID=2817901 RepID=UPI0020A23127|nr:DUF4167 domain-containing protein [Sphingobium sp. OAS761]MCP1470164.1 hypothetical protein [Sphingobium sp. OAS761]